MAKKMNRRKDRKVFAKTTAKKASNRPKLVPRGGTRL